MIMGNCSKSDGLFRSRLIKRFRKQEDGAAAVEFAMIALPFFALIFAIFELAIFFFASRYIEDGLFNASRKVLTQRLPAGNVCTEFKKELATNFTQWLDPTKIVITAKPLSSFSGTEAAADFGSGSCSFGAPGSVVVLSVTYPYPFNGFRFSSGSAAIGRNMPLYASTAFRVEQ
ncbi:MAG: TadE/TadG family type IV pilus assembly protein [Beijerinckiaceae bacterium]